MAQVGFRIRMLREARGLSQEKLAQNIKHQNANIKMTE